MTFEPDSPRRDDAHPTTYNLLFVCTGNTCRSPLAAAIARQAVGERGWTHVSVQSAGIATMAGAPASQGALVVAQEHGLELETHVSQPLTRELVDWADLILGMGHSHLVGIAELGAADKSALVTDFLAEEWAGGAIADPFGGDISEYRATYQQLHNAITVLIARLEPILAP
jgi:protein-tyrosine-phosphatase